nr:glycosidase [Desulfobacterales bacterium]
MDASLHPFRRYDKNPILLRSDIPYLCNTVFNAAACKFKDRYVLLLRVEGLNGLSHLTLAYSEDGYEFAVEDSPWIMPSQDPTYEVYERYGIEDPRITPIGDTFYITYTAFGPYGPRGGIGYTKDFHHFQRVTLATTVDDKDLVLFPEKIGGNYVMLNRPGGIGKDGGSIWITYSPDLVYWGKAKVVLSPEPGWSSSKLGISTPPIKTERGWLTFYHGVKQTGSGRLYRIGALLLDLKNPEQIVGYTSHFIFGPEESYERTGDVPNVVFPCGVILEPDRTIKMYYGAADTCIALAEANLDDILGLCTTRQKRGGQLLKA